MTEVVDAAQCAMRRDLGTDTTAELPFGDLFGKGVSRGIDLNDEFTPGPDSRDDPRCSRGSLPGGDAVWCGQPPPWLSADWMGMVDALGADRIRRAFLSADDGASVDGQMPGRTVAYVEIELRRGDPRGTLAFLESAFTSCADAAPGTVSGLKVMAGSVPSAHGTQGEASAVAFLTPERAAWVVLDGGEWTKTERERALRAIAAHLA